mmetsp:Transcript_17349/g.29684  ORF Transcript_17349/g.29684 Transcript_17349/m.29684 type:complete len:275 (+) Transcript_17349:1698-2522(+)
MARSSAVARPPSARSRSLSTTTCASALAASASALAAPSATQRPFSSAQRAANWDSRKSIRLRSAAAATAWSLSRSAPSHSLARVASSSWRVVTSLCAAWKARVLLTQLLSWLMRASASDSSLLVFACASRSPSSSEVRLASSAATPSSIAGSVKLSAASRLGRTGGRRGALLAGGGALLPAPSAVELRRAASLRCVVVSSCSVSASSFSNSLTFSVASLHRSFARSRSSVRSLSWAVWTSSLRCTCASCAVGAAGSTGPELGCNPRSCCTAFRS